MPSKASVKKFLKRTALVCLSIFAVAVLMIAFWNWRAARQLEVYLTTLREAGKPLNIQELGPAAVPDQQNAANLLQRVLNELTDYNRRLAESTRQLETEPQQESAMIEVARATEQLHPELVAELQELSRLRDYQLPIDYSLAPTPFMEQLLQHLGPPRSVARVLYGHGLMSLADDETDEAARDAIAIWKWSEHVASQPLLTSALVASALRSTALDLSARVLYQRDASPQVRRQLLAVVGNQDQLVADFHRTLDSERAFGLSSYNALPGPTARILNALGDQKSYLEMWDRARSIVEAPSGIMNETPESALGYLSSTLWPAIRQGLITMRRVQAQTRALLLLAAWQDQAHGVEVNVEEIDLPEAVATDPFSGGSMIILPVGDTIAVYSVGENLIDDGGEIANGQDIGVEPIAGIRPATKPASDDTRTDGRTHSITP